MKFYWTPLGPEEERVIGFSWPGHFVIALVLPRLIVAVRRRVAR